MPKVGREYQHLEDLVFIEGSQGAARSIKILKNISKNINSIYRKWDGNPTIYFGRDNQGQFSLIGKNGWGKFCAKDSSSLKEFIKKSGNQEEWRNNFAESMSEVFELFEKSIPEHIRGYYYGDLLYYPSKSYKVNDKNIEFTPNKVTYLVTSNSNLGQKIKQSKVGIVIHKQYNRFGSDSSILENIDVFESDSNTLILYPEKIDYKIKIDNQKLKIIEKFLNMHSQDIDEFLKIEKGFSDIKNIIYTYVNFCSRNKILDELETNFFDWLKSSKVSQSKQDKILKRHNKNPEALFSIFWLVIEIMKIKDSVIDQIDQYNLDIVEYTDSQQGGEGYIISNDKIKLVPRKRWSPN